MATKLTVKRSDLVDAIKAKAKANKEAYDKAVEANTSSTLVKSITAAIDESFKTVVQGGYNPAGYNKTNAQSYASSLYTALGIRSMSVPEPRLFEKELAVLEMAQDETLSIDDGSDYFNFLKS